MKIKIEVVKGVEGHALSVDDTRVAGPKPWGGGTVVHSFEVDVHAVETLVKEFKQKERNKLGMPG